MRPSAATLESEMSPSELEFLTSLIKKNAFTGPHLEIGTAAGGTLCRMIKAAEKTQPRFVAVDPMNYFADQENTVRRNLSQNGIDSSSVDIRAARSYQAFLKAKKQKESFDFILIDGAHNIKYVTQDLSWTRLLRPGGIVTLHDYCHQTVGVQIAANRFLRKHKNYKIIGQVGSLLAIQKQAKSKRTETSTFDLILAYLTSPFLQLQASVKKKIRKAKEARANRSSR